MVALLTALLLFAPTTIELSPTDDVWVYPHASDPGKDPFLRVWGTEDKATADSSDELDGYSYGYLKFDLASVPKELKLTSATLVLTHTADPVYTETLVKAHPLEARPLTAPFTEKTWDYGQTSKVFPNPEIKSVYGSAYPEKIPSDGKAFSLSIDLLKGPGQFVKAIQGATELNLAITSSISPEVGGRNAVYKVYSRDAENESYRPKMVLVYE